jgi:hypothetical protein
LAAFTFAAWQVAAWWVAPRLDPLRSGADLMAQAVRELPPGAELGLVDWKEQMLLHAGRPVVHFGFRREPQAELRDAAAWLAGSPQRRLLLPLANMAPCLDPQATRIVANRHREEWRLAGAEALTGECRLAAPRHVTRYGLSAPFLNGLRSFNSSM